MGDMSWRITMAERPPNGNGLLPTGIKAFAFIMQLGKCKLRKMWLVIVTQKLAHWVYKSKIVNTLYTQYLRQWLILNVTEILRCDWLGIVMWLKCCDSTFLVLMLWRFSCSATPLGGRASGRSILLQNMSRIASLRSSSNNWRVGQIRMCNSINN